MAELNPTIRAVRAPKMMRDNRSRPNWSVPNRCVQLGASVIEAKSFDVGLYSAINSAVKPAKAIISTISMPNAPSGSRRQKCSVVCQIERRICPSSSAMAGTAMSLCDVVDMMQLPSGEADAWIEPRIEQIDDQIGQHEDGDGQHHQRLVQCIVLVLHRLLEHSAEAVQVEHLLRHHQSTDQERELDADHRHHWQQCVLQCVAIDDQLLDQTLGAGGADVILAQYLQHGGSRHAHADRGIAVADGD